MKIGMVVTVSPKWYGNVLRGIGKGDIEVDYWTNGWLPDPSIKLDRLEVYYEGSCILEGDVINQYKATPNSVFNRYMKNTYPIGLEPKDKFIDFQTMLDAAFRTPCKPQIGNIVFRVDGISGGMIDGLKSSGIYIPENVKILPSKKLDHQINNIAYRDI